MGQKSDCGDRILSAVEGGVMHYEKAGTYNCHVRTPSDIFTGFMKEVFGRNCSGNALICTLID